ncbi:MAG: hypothetical protein AAF067_08035 [Pseudomonadota bacterium]
MINRIFDFVIACLLMCFLASCSYFESSFVERDRLIKDVSVTLAVQFVDKTANQPVCSATKMAVFEFEPDGSGLVQWLNESGEVPLHGCTYSELHKSEKFTLSDLENYKIRTNIARIDWPIRQRWRSNACRLVTNEVPPLTLQFGHGDEIPSYHIYPYWIGGGHVPSSCVRKIEVEIDRIRNVVSFVPVSIPRNFVIGL